jgi:hypothetical protein
MSETDDRYQNQGEKEQVADDKDVEGHQIADQGAPRATEGEDGEPDVEGHQIAPQTEG